MERWKFYCDKASFEKGDQCFSDYSFSFYDGSIWPGLWILPPMLRQRAGMMLPCVGVRHGQKRFK